jgi:hypothetical protein
MSYLHLLHRLIIKDDGFTEDAELKAKHLRQAQRQSVDGGGSVDGARASSKTGAAFVKRDLDARMRTDLFR